MPPPAVAQGTPPPKPNGHHYAPEGWFFILKYVSQMTPQGPVGFEPGREVQFVKAFQDRQTLLVSDGRYKLEVSPKYLTNDMEVADYARSQDEASQLQVALYQERENRLYYAHCLQVNMEAAARIQNAEENRINGNTIGNWDNALNRPAELSTSSYYSGSIWQGSPYSYFY